MSGPRTSELAGNRDTLISDVRKGLGLDGQDATRGKAIIEAITPAPDHLHIRMRSIAPYTHELEVRIAWEEMQANSASPDSLSACVIREILSAWLNKRFDYAIDLRRPLQRIAAREPELSSCVLSPYTAEIAGHLRASRDVVVTGKSASGKTIAALQAALALTRDGFGVAWIDLSEPDRSMWDVAIALFKSSAGRAFYVFADDAQANPGETTQIAALQSLVAPVRELQFCTAAISWTSARQNLIELWPNSPVINVQSARVLHDISAADLNRKYSHSIHEQIEHIASGDLVVAKIAISFVNREGRFPTGLELAEEALSKLVGEHILGEKGPEIIYRCAALSQFEIDIASAYLEQISKTEIEDLTNRKIIRRTGSFLSLGHRSYSRLLLKGIATRFSNAVGGLPSPTKLAVEYLRTAETRQLVATLERLDIARLQLMPHDQHGTRVLIKLWDTLRLLLKKLAEAGSSDPSWRDDTGSATFASRVLGEFNLEGASEAVELQRQRWFLDQGTGIHPRLPVPNERKDFDEIERCMREEDASSSILPSYAEKHDQIDFDRMHCTWALGLLLGLEGAAHDYLPDRINALKLIVEKGQLPNGAFYPSRVPWVTARVLIGLSQVGETIETSVPVQRGCQWLLQDAPDGPCDFGAWNPYTGIWNTVLGTTAMCLNALVRCGVPTEHPSVELGMNYLMDGRGEWSRAGQEIDCAFALETFFLTGYRWREFSAELHALINWAHDPKIWKHVVLDASQAKDESLKIPFIASSLIGIIWSIVKSELPLLLEDLASGSFLPDTISRDDYKSELQSILQALEELKAHVRTNIEQRLMMLSSLEETNVASVQRKLKQFRDLANRCDRAIDQARRLAAEGLSRSGVDASLQTLRMNVDELGTEIFQNQWRHLN